MSYYLFLDDERNPNQVTWVNIPRDRIYEVVRNYDQFVQHVTEKGLPSYVTFDHDLADAHYAAMLEENQSSDNKFTIWMPGDDDNVGMNITVDYGPEKTGYDCAKWLVDYCADNGLKFPAYAVHSLNPIGSKRINDYIINAKQHLDI